MDEWCCFDGSGDPEYLRRLVRLKVLGTGIVWVRASAITAIAEHGANSLVTMDGGAPEFVVEEPVSEVVLRWSNELAVG